MAMGLADIIVIAIVGFFIFWSFSKHKLPKDDQKKRDKSASILDFPKSPEPETQTKPKPNKKPKVDLSKYEGIEQVKAADPNFNEKEFIKGAQAAYEFYYEAWNKKDDSQLANFLGPKLLDDAINTFNKLDEKKQSPLVEINHLKASIVDGRVSGKTAIVDVKFTAEQSENVVDEKGKIVGKKKPAKTVTTIWTLARVIDSNDPNWELENISKPS